jgi:hypothetical protein
MNKVIAAVCGMLFLSSCSTGYHGAGLFLNGYDEFKLSPNTYRVRFLGNEFTSENQVYKYAMRRSAELTKEQGFRYFKIMRSSSDNNRSTYVRPVTQESTSNKSTFTETKVTKVSGGDVVEIDNPSTALEIKMYQHPVEGALDADIILSNFPNKKNK